MKRSLLTMRKMFVFQNFLNCFAIILIEYKTLSSLASQTCFPNQVAISGASLRSVPISSDDYEANLLIH